ncbi:MAG: hypothetical protein ABR516_06835, partial [Desulfuromonadaceae bacterium]
IWALMLICSAAVVFNAGVRFPWLALFAPSDTHKINSASTLASGPESEHVSDPKGSALGVMAASALICLVFGWVPAWFYTLLPYPGSYHPYTPGHLLEQVQILSAAGAVFWFTRHYFYPRRGITLDTDWFLRLALLKGWKRFVYLLRISYTRATGMLANSRIRSYMLIFSLHGPRGILARSWHTGSIALWVALMLASYILVYNFSAPSVLNTLRQLFTPG